MRIIAALVLASLCTTAQAATYKCTGPDGSTTFSDKPCAGQDSEEVAVDYVEPTDEQRSAAIERSRVDRDSRRRASDEGSATGERARLSVGMTKAEVRSAWGAPDFTSPTMWGYHNDPRGTVTFGAGGRVTSAVGGL